jgi:uncharacterized protein YecE (DUF72 family)
MADARGNGSILVGIGGWDFDPWRGTFYPPGLRRADQLAYAASRVTAIEINATFYKLQKPDLYARWAAAVPEEFRFALKGSRFCTNRKALGEAGEAVARFCGQGLVELGPRLGPILWQLAETKRFDAEEMEAFFALLPRVQDGVPLRHAVEVRHESFADPAFAEIARRAGVAVAFVDEDGVPALDAPAPGLAYARLKRMSEAEPAGYSAAALDRWAALARDWSAGGRDSFVFMIGGFKQRAPAAAEALLARLRAAGVA